MSALVQQLRDAMRAFDALHGEGAAARELAACWVVFCGGAALMLGLAIIGEPV